MITKNFDFPRFLHIVGVSLIEFLFEFQNDKENTFSGSFTMKIH